MQKNVLSGLAFVGGQNDGPGPRGVGGEGNRKRMRGKEQLKEVVLD